MATISSIANNSYSMYKMAEEKTKGADQKTESKETKALREKSDATIKDAAQKRESAIRNAQQKVSSMTNLVNSFGGYSASRSSGNTLSSLWSSYQNASMGLANLRGISSGAASLVQSYNTAQKTFGTEYGSAMSDLKGAADTVSKMNFNFTAADITKKEDGTATYSDGLQSAIDNVKSLVKSYNDALGVTTDYKSIGTRMTRLNSSFMDTTYRADTYKQFGIDVDGKTGRLSVDTEKLAESLTTNGNAAEAVLGENGLAGKAANHAAFAQQESSKVFPSMQNLLGAQMNQAAAYTNPRVLQSTMNAAMIGNLIDSLF